MDSSGFVWITGNAGWDPPATDGRSDDMILKFTSEGKFVLQIGRRGQSVGIDSGRIAILDRRTLTEIGSYGQRGQFGILHHMAADAEGSLYTADVRSQRAQRFVAPTKR